MTQIIKNGKILGSSVGDIYSSDVINDSSLPGESLNDALESINSNVDCNFKKLVYFNGQAAGAVIKFCHSPSNHENPSGGLAIASTNDNLVNRNIAPLVMPSNVKITRLHLLAMGAAVNTGTVGDNPTARLDVLTFTNTAFNVAATLRLPAVHNKQYIKIWNDLSGAADTISFSIDTDVNIPAFRPFGLIFVNENGDNYINGLLGGILLIEGIEV